MARLRNRRLLGFKFRRQAPFGPYVADFLCREVRLVIEADGGQHRETAEADAARTRLFEAHGYHVLRFWNGEILADTDGVLGVIADALLTLRRANAARASGDAGS